jgi:hypothetical protein
MSKPELDNLVRIGRLNSEPPTRDERRDLGLRRHRSARYSIRTLVRGGSAHPCDILGDRRNPRHSQSVPGAGNSTFAGWRCYLTTICIEWKAQRANVITAGRQLSAALPSLAADPRRLGTRQAMTVAGLGFVPVPSTSGQPWCRIYAR